MSNDIERDGPQRQINAIRQAMAVIRDRMDAMGPDEIGPADLLDADLQTLEQIAADIEARAQGGDAEPVTFLIWSNEHNAYWRPRSAGYTRMISEAGRYTQAEADKICKNASPRAGSELDETVPPEMMMVAPECIGKTHPAPTGDSGEAELPAFDPTRSREEQGLYGKYYVRRADGSDQPGGKHHGCRYFVLDVDHDKYAAAALGTYAKQCEQEYPELAKDLREKFGAAPTGTVPEGVREQIERLVLNAYYHTDEEDNNVNADDLRAGIDRIMGLLAAAPTTPAPSAAKVPEGWLLRRVDEYLANEPAVSDGGDPEADFLRDRIQALLSTNTTSPGSEWVRCSERLPTEADADALGFVWTYNNGLGITVLDRNSFTAPPFYTHWKPTGLKRPQPPREQEG